MTMTKQFLWTERYRPATLSECILPEAVRKPLEGFLKAGDVPNTIFCGTQGVGKTAAAIALCQELGADYLKINASLERNIDVLRNTILRFASTQSLMSTGRKIVILDEADYLNKQSTQPALRAFMEDYSSNCGFILTCNHKEQLIKPLWSRSPPLEFEYPKRTEPEAKVLMTRFLKRCCEILDAEEIEYDQKTIGALIKKYYPDWRSVINILQRYGQAGAIDSGVLTAKNHSFDTLVGSLKNKEFKVLRQWATDNAELSAAYVFRYLYDRIYDLLVPATIPQGIIILNEGQKADSMVNDRELNIVATLTEFMATVEFK